MTREKFIKKWLGNKHYQYTEQNRDLMRDDLDEVINQALRQTPVSGLLPLDKLRQKLDEALAKETPETLIKWLEEMRQ
jgi:type IV secretory pathway VirB4 component